VGALQRAAGPSLEVVIAGDPGADDTAALISTVREMYLPHAAVLLVPSGPSGAAIRRLAPFADAYTPVQGKAAAYVCQDFACQLPTTDPDKLTRLLKEAISKPEASP
jgi:uncharacterized protein YyaL (SSP411 family)